MATTQQTIFGTTKFKDLVRPSSKFPDAMQNAIGLPDVCAACHDVLGSENGPREVVSENVLRRRLSLAELRASAETGGRRLCGIFLCTAVYSVARDDDPFDVWPVSSFLDAYGALEVRIRVRVALRSGNLKMSDRDVHELIVYGGVRQKGEVRTYWLDNGIPFRFRAYARKGDEVAKAYISTAECDLGLYSDAALSRIRFWMATCDEHHSLCSGLKSGPLPTRVVDVSNPARLKLCDVDDDDCRYAALNYCWGGGDQIKTTNSSLEAAYTTIEPSYLPQAIQDAVKVTRQIGLARLWVDALCIVQDSPADMEKEIGKMGHIYQNASFTIMAANSSHSGLSFLTPEGPPRRLEPQPYRFRLPMVFPNGTVRDIGVEPPVSWSPYSPEPLDQRGWAFQESVLSRRAIVYGTSTLTWRCAEAVEGWNSWVREHQKYVASNLRLGRRGRELYGRIWRDLVRLYSRRELTFPEDKLPAVSGLASEVFRLSEADGDGPGRYLAGIWENNLVEQLCWYTIQGHSRDVRGENMPFRAPSWSWASVESPVKYGVGGTPWPAGTEMEVLDCNTVLRSELLPMEQVLGGRLRVRGCLFRGSDVPRPETWKLGTYAGKPSEVMLRMDGYGAGDEDAVSKARSCGWLRVLNNWGLVLECVEGSVYRRVGAVSWDYWANREVSRTVIDII